MFFYDTTSPSSGMLSHFSFINKPRHRKRFLRDKHKKIQTSLCTYTYSDQELCYTSLCSIVPNDSISGQ